MSLPYAVQFRGFTACPCLAEWLPAYERMLRHFKVISPKDTLRIYQLIGGSKKSAGTHLEGGAFDLLDLPGDKDIWIARQMGADATWTRPPNWDGKGGIEHNHGVLTGCPHNAPAAYQIDAVRSGFNGLGRGGRGGKDTGPRPLSGRTWRQGIEWANKQEDDMPYTQQELTNIIRAAVRAELDATGLDELPRLERDRFQSLRTKANAIAAKLGIKL